MQIGGVGKWENEQEGQDRKKRFACLKCKYLVECCVVQRLHERTVVDLVADFPVLGKKYLFLAFELGQVLHAPSLKNL
jgi:hypothetical protein